MLGVCRSAGGGSAVSSGLVFAFSQFVRDGVPTNGAVLERASLVAVGVNARRYFVADAARKVRARLLALMVSVVSFLVCWGVCLQVVLECLRAGLDSRWSFTTVLGLSGERLDVTQLVFGDDDSDGRLYVYASNRVYFVDVVGSGGVAFVGAGGVGALVRDGVGGAALFRDVQAMVYCGVKVLCLLDDGVARVVQVATWSVKTLEGGPGLWAAGRAAGLSGFGALLDGGVSMFSNGASAGLVVVDANQLYSRTVDLCQFSGGGSSASSTSSTPSASPGCGGVRHFSLEAVPSTAGGVGYEYELTFMLAGSVHVLGLGVCAFGYVWDSSAVGGGCVALPCIRMNTCGVNEVGGQSDASVCFCATGFYFNRGSRLCELCPVGSYCMGELSNEVRICGCVGCVCVVG